VTSVAIRSVEPSYVEELHLTAFKSFSEAVLPLSEFTLLIGRNGSGKSNALDALSVLARLASGDDVRDALDGSRGDREPIRGGAEGCAPFGQDHFELGCRVRTGGEVVDFEVQVWLQPHLRIGWERLSVHSGVHAGRVRLDGKDLLLSDENADPESGDLWARYYNGKRGVNPSVPFNASRLLLSQVPARVPTQSEATRVVHRAAAQVQEALQAIFVLDPVPALMRQYVNERDDDLRRDGSNLSAVVARLRREDPAALEELTSVVKELSEQPVRRVDTERSSLGDVLLVLHERDPWDGRRTAKIPARLMSDGTLRFLAIGTAVLSAPRVGTTRGRPGEDVEGQRTLVLEEIESGLHPTQAGRVLELIRDESASRQIRTLATTHSPAILNALEGPNHDSVVVCDRAGEGGTSRLRRLIDLPGYPELMAAGRLGSAVTQGRLAAAAEPRAQEFGEFDRVLEAL
jgi:predicted ATPase